MQWRSWRPTVPLDTAQVETIHFVANIWSIGHHPTPLHDDRSVLFPSWPPGGHVVTSLLVALLPQLPLTLGRCAPNTLACLLDLLADFEHSPGRPALGTLSQGASERMRRSVCRNMHMIMICLIAVRFPSPHSALNETDDTRLILQLHAKAAPALIVCTGYSRLPGWWYAGHD